MTGQQWLNILKKDFATAYGLLCFSQDGTNPVLWSHYADKHKGVCLEFALPNQFAEPVRYTSERLPLNEGRPFAWEDLGVSCIKDMLHTKFEGWSYEKELRSFLRLEEPDSRTGKYYYPFGGDLTLTRVIAGPSCAAEDMAKIDAVARSYATRPELVKARLASSSFRVIVDERAFVI